VWSYETRVVVYYSKSQQRKAWPQREGESALTAVHSCHRARLPFGHVLIERRCGLKHCKRECNKEKKAQQQTRYRFKIQNRTTECEHCGGHIEREAAEDRDHLLYPIFITAPVFHVDTFWLNTDASTNTARVEGAQRKINPPYRSKNKIKERLVR